MAVNMLDYNYECINKQGEIVTGKISSENFSSAVERLRKMELSIIDLQEIDTTRSKVSLFSSTKKVSLADLSMFSSQLSAMIGAGIPVTRSLFTIGQQTTNASLKKALTNIAQNVEGGMSLTDAFGLYPDIFSDLYISMIHSCEVGGMLEESLNRLADQLEKEKMIRDNVKSATFYPRMVAGFAVILFLGMLVLLVPIFRGFMPENADIPAITQAIFALSDSIKSQWYIWILVIAIIILGVYIFIKSPTGNRIWDGVKFKIPAFGPIIHKAVLARFARTLSTLLEGGIPVIQALESAGPTSGSILLTEAVEKAARKIEEGKSIAQPLEESKLFPPMMIQMIAVGEETGSLSSLLDKVAGFYEEEVSTLTKGLTTIIEPIMLVVVGVIVGVMLVSLYLPIFTAITQSGM
jgi:type IV pilus assembly protein PilC